MKVKVTLTLKEAEALVHAIGNSLEDAKDLFPNGHDAQAAYRGLDKLSKAIVKYRPLITARKESDDDRQV